MTIVDTSVWVDYLGGRTNLETEWVESRVGRQSLGITDLILCEVLQGVRHDAMFRLVQQQMGALSLFESCGARIATASAMNYRALRAKGHTIRTNVDCLIATLCIENGFSLLHRDRDFDVFEEHLGLQVEHPQSE